MENNLENKVSMYQKVQFYLNLHAAETAAIPMVSTVKGQLDTKVTAILALASLVDTDITGYTVDKQNKRADLASRILKLSTAIVALASINSNTILAEKCDESLSSMNAMRDNDFYTFAQLIIKEATPIMATLTPFGVVAADLTAANAASATYLGAIQTPRGQINERSKSLQDLQDAMASADTLLRDKMDAVMGVYQATNPSLHFGYLGARSIDQTGATTAPDYMGAVLPASTTNVANIPYLAARTFEIQNMGNTELIFALTTDPALLDGHPVTISAGSSVQRGSTNLNESELATYLILRNDDVNVSGSYKIWITE